MATDIADPKRQSMLLECQTSWCKQNGRQWRVWCTAILPGLISVPDVRCTGCLCNPVIIQEMKVRDD